MEQELISKGKCLAIHLMKMTKEDTGKSLENYCHIGMEAHDFFLQLLVRGDTSIINIDWFLRNIWLDCCGHLSQFGYKNYEISMGECGYTGGSIDIERDGPYKIA